MANPDIYNDFVEFNVSITPGTLAVASLARCAVVSTFTATEAFPGRTKVYSGAGEQIRMAVLDDGFSITSAPYLQTFAFTNNAQPVNELMVARIDAADASLTASLTAITGADDSFFGFCVDTRNKVKQLEAFQFAQTKKNKWFLSYTKDPLALTEDPASLPLQLKALQIEWGMLVWYDPEAATKYGPAVVLSKPGTFKVPHNGTLKLRVAGGVEQTFTFLATAAAITGNVADNYSVTAGQTLILAINGGPDVTVVAPTTVAAMTAAQAAEMIAAQVGGIIGTNTTDFVTLTTSKLGSGASIQIKASTLATTFGLAVSTVNGTGSFADNQIATGGEVATKIGATLTGATAIASGTRFKLTSTGLGSGASIEITGGTLVDEFGLELGIYAGVGTTENYLDCQLLGRIASFDLDAPDGSVGFDNQTVPQTPGNTLKNTERKAIWRSYCNTYEAVTNDRPGELHPGICPRGFDADVVWSAFWFRVRGTERVKRMQDAMANSKLRIPYDEVGIAKYAQVLRALMLDGARNGHIQGPDLQPKDPLGIRASYFQVPTIKEQTPAHRATGTFGGFATLQLSRGSAKRIIVNMEVQTP